MFFTHYINTRYVKPSTKLSLERAVKIDKCDQSQNFSSDAYQQPVLSEKALVPMPYRLGDDQDDNMLAEVMAKLIHFQENPAEHEVV